MTEKQTIYDELEQAIDLLKKHFLALKGRDVDEVLMARKALAAMLGTLGDAFTNYIPPNQFENYRSRKQQQVVGIGLQVEPDDEGIIRIISPMTGAPTDIPQIQTGYELAEVDDNPLRGADVATVSRMMSGAIGSTARLLVRTPSGTEIVVSVARRAVDVDYMHWSMADGDLAIVRIAWFSGTVHEAFVSRLEQAIDAGARGLLIDLRSNSGGSIIATRNIFSSLCDEPVMYLGKKRHEDNIPDRVLGQHRFDLPVVVLINEGTFSAGEVLAGALQDHKRAKLVGAPSGGKGSMQQVFPLEGQIGGALRITTATNCTPSGRIVQDQGIEPDVAVPLDHPELFIADGPQNISDRGRRYLQQMRLEQLLQQVAESGDASERLRNAFEQGDQQLQQGLAVLRGDTTSNSAS